jgi:hypothetical protein
LLVASAYEFVTPPGRQVDPAFSESSVAVFLRNGPDLTKFAGTRKECAYQRVESVIIGRSLCLRD